MKVALFSLCILLGLSAQAPLSLASPDTAGVDAVPLQQYLRTVGVELRCHFTVEDDSHWEAYQGPQGELEGVSTPNDLLKVTVRPTHPTTVPLLIEDLRRLLPDVDVFAEPGHPDIIHLVARSLEGDDGYVMNRKISLTADLVPDKLLLMLAKMLNHEVGLPSMRSLHDFYGDTVTNLHITADSQTVRQTLTNYIPLAGYAPILWTSVSLASYNNSHQVEVKYAMVMPSQ